MLPLSFQTARLTARLPVPSDGEHIFAAYASRPEVSRYMMWRPHADLATTVAFITDCMAAARAGTRFPYVLARSETSQVPIGMLEARPLGHKVDLGYVLAPDHWGHGYMPEAISVLAAHALNEAGFFRVQAFCDVENLPSRRALEKAGFVCEGRHERFVVHPNLDPEPRPCFMYAKCR
jgi:RimJ/RimL family protein N-acetyltransferase